MMTCRRNALDEARTPPVTNAWAGSGQSKSARVRALIGVAAAASVITAGCTPLVGAGGGGTTVKPTTTTTTKAGTVTLAPVADSFIYADSLDRNVGTGSSLVASSVTGAGKTAFVKFEVSGVPAGVPVAAHLLLTRTDHHLPSIVRISTASNAWSETGLTARNAPAVGSTVVDVHPSSVPTVMNVNVSSVVRGNGTVTLAISEPVADATAVFYSRTAGTNEPSLVVSYGGSTPSTPPISPDPTPTPTPTATPTPTPTPTATPTPTPTATPTPTSTCTVSSILVASCGVWWGIGVNPLHGESWDQALTDFESTQGRLSDLLHYYHVGATTFPTALEISRSHQGGLNRLLLENWKPEQGRSWAQVAAGDATVDRAIDAEATYLKTTFTSKFFLAIHHEPEDEVNPTTGSGMTAADYRAMFRHVVQRLRADGVTNAVFVVDYMGTAHWGSQSWFTTLYPGDDVVDWIAEDPYSTGSGAPWRADFGGMVNRRDGSSWPGFYTWATTTHPGKPIMLAEWGVTEDPKNANAKTSFFNTQLAVEKNYPAIKALVYWNAPTFPALGNGATAINSSLTALTAFRQLSKAPGFNTPLP